MKNGNFKLVGGLLAGLLIGGVTVVGANQAIQAIQNTEINVSLNGEIQTFKDETTGEVQYPITYHDRTYLPLRTLANLVGVDVDYDVNNNTATLNSNDDSDIYFVDIDGDSQNELIIDAYGNNEQFFVFKKEIYTGSNWKLVSASKDNIYRNMFSLYKVYGTNNGVYILNSTGETDYLIDEVSKIEIEKIGDNYQYKLISVFAKESIGDNTKFYVNGSETTREEYEIAKNKFEANN